MQKIRTVIVDDEARIRRGIERLVQSCGEEWEVVATLSDGKEALDYLHGSQGAVDLLISDVKMPVMDGLALIKEAKRHYSFYPMLISGYDDFEYLQTAIREGAVDYLLKPVDREQFRERLAELRAKILEGRSESWRREETERQAVKLKPARQTQTLSYITSAGIDIERLGYWVEDFPRGRYLLLYASLDSLPVKSRGYTTKDWEAYTFALENIIAEVVANYERQTGLQGWSWRGGNTDFWILIGCGDGEVELEREGLALSEQVRGSIQTYMPFTISVSIAEPIEDLYLLPGARREALSLMHYRLVEGGNRVFRQADRAASEEADGSASLSRAEVELAQLAQRLRQAVAHANAEEAESLLRQYFAELERSGSPAVIRGAAQNLLIQIHSVALEGGGAEGAPDSVEQAIRSLDHVTRLSELRGELAGRMNGIMGAIREARSEGNRKPVEQAKAWIRDHLGGDLSIKRIADHVYMNPTYFCEYFKLQTGETVLDYVTRQRMEKAREMLGDPAAKLQDISLKVGYQDVKYFSKLFKAWAGVSPSKYREQAMMG
ncbi:response regulator transcription factor [Cohnella thailandensis]|uniref:Response regulator n=1 Tax=Cohnella thailandensis TaxID=557557 RepID=A0A841T4A5_9BACL|nr:response regulator [Cohnella thailandensis]MBB6637829.1 response regulator [Cohnella thailandensis]MBP1973991.1 two-component system response regulator YesN [Cohnella thailandensis]